MPTDISVITVFPPTIPQTNRRIGFPACAGPPCGLASLPDIRRSALRTRFAQLGSLNVHNRGLPSFGVFRLLKTVENDYFE